MKLPTDKNERMKILGLIGFGIVAVIVCAIWFGLMPMLEQREKLKKDIVSLNEKLAQADKENKQRGRDIDNNHKTIQSIKDISDKYMIKPVLNNYVLEATDFIESQGKSVGVKITGVHEGGFTEVSRLGDIRNAKAYIVHVNVECGYSDFVKLLHQIESANPYYSVSSITITGQPIKDPRKQLIAFELQWPTWSDTDMPAKLDEQLAEVAKLEMEEQLEAKKPIQK